MARIDRAPFLLLLDSPLLDFPPLARCSPLTVSLVTRGALPLPPLLGLPQMALRQVVPVVPEEALQAQVVPHWAKLPKKYEQLKKKAADVKRRRKIAERQALPPSLYRSLFG